VLAALNHPNIGAIDGLEKTRDFTALVMELVEGRRSARAGLGRSPVFHVVVGALTVAALSRQGSQRRLRDVGEARLALETANDDTVGRHHAPPRCVPYARRHAGGKI
jgi:hypothetical protein